MKITIGSSHSSESKKCIHCEKMTTDYVVLRGTVDVDIPKHPKCPMKYTRASRAISAHAVHLLREAQK